MDTPEASPDPSPDRSNKDKIIIICVACFGLFLVFGLIGGLLGVISGDLPESSQASATQTIATSTPEVIKTYAIINLCINDPENADLWMGDTLRIWKSADREGLKVAGELPACKNIRVEILDEKTNDNGVIQCKIKSEEYKIEGWVSKYMLILEDDSKP